MSTPVLVLLISVLVIVIVLNMYEGTLATREREDCRLEKKNLAIKAIRLEQREAELDDREKAISFLEEDSVVVSSKYVTSESDINKYSTIEDMEKAIHKRLVSNIGQTIAKEYTPKLNIEETAEGRLCYSIRLRIKQV